MKTNMKNESSNQPQSAASVVDGKLILSLPDAAIPSVWQMDLEEAKSSALEVLEDKKNNQFILNLKKTGDESVEIAPFDSRESAVSALMAASQALAGAHGKIRPGAAPAVQEGPVVMTAPAPGAPQQTKGGMAKGGAILATFLIIVLLIFWTVSISLKGSTITPPTSTASSASGQGGVEAGVPLSADDFLRNR